MDIRDCTVCHSYQRRILLKPGMFRMVPGNRLRDGQHFIVTEGIFYSPTSMRRSMSFSFSLSFFVLDNAVRCRHGEDTYRL